MDPRLPFVAESSLSIGPYVIGGAGTPPVSFDASRYVNTFRTPIEVRELSIVVESRGASGNEVAAPNITYLSMKLGRHFMTDGFVPISVLAPYKLSAGGNSSYSETYPIDAASGGLAAVYLRRMLFPTPLILKPGEAFGFQARIPSIPLLINDAVSTTILVRIAMIGRFLTANDRIPATNRVPMISFVEMTQAKRMSFETDLRNPLDAELDVHHLILSPWYRQTSTGAAYDIEDFNGNGTVGVGSTLALRFPHGELINSDADLIPLREIFSPMHVCPIKFTLPRASRIQASLGANASEVVGQALPTAYQIALFGTREEAL